MNFAMPLNNPRRTRLLTIGCGVAVFFWLRIEDNNVIPALIAGLGLSLLGIYLWITKNLSGKTLGPRHLLLASALLGAVCGLATTALTAGLMLVKNGLHGARLPRFSLRRDRRNIAASAVVGARRRTSGLRFGTGVVGAD